MLQFQKYKYKDIKRYVYVIIRVKNMKNYKNNYTLVFNYFRRKMSLTNRHLTRL